MNRNTNVKALQSRCRVAREEKDVKLQVDVYYSVSMDSVE